MLVSELGVCRLLLSSCCFGSLLAPLLQSHVTQAAIANGGSMNGSGGGGAYTGGEQPGLGPHPYSSGIGGGGECLPRGDPGYPRYIVARCCCCVEVLSCLLRQNAL
ncbi:hypothetical protein PR001_g18056 [Phytophthora rubi]|uniref:Secreted protein n=1 Tax=Phytophthora rubi TaxID=129364 RepID=A0A6A3K4T9_9STRA|nr:hypothetical protein PR002_g17950 [Phytophthora rubi]KAE9003151.1 hypothetical protein PR001_g18056 [Phytophthora rubi]